MKIHETGCPICGKDYRNWSLGAQAAHVTLKHSWLQRLRLFRQTRKRLIPLLTQRKYGKRVK